MVIDKAELHRMSQAERQELACLLAELGAPVHPAGPVAPGKPAVPRNGAAAPGPPLPLRADPYRIDPSLRRERRLALAVSAAACVILAGWTVLLAATLPHHFSAHHWRAVWVNFDVFLLAAFAATAWAIWRQRQVLILLLMIIGTMLCCDAWFDVGTSLATSGLGISLLTAVVAELPLAFLAFAGARRLLRATVAAGILAGAHAGATAARAIPAGEWGRSCAGQSLRRTPLAGLGLDEALPRRHFGRTGRGEQAA
ncbi:MAG TPA: hypothetical protein VFW50_09450 [Streptosporangiaceae bacterium]|nr:hypothetical protein [Streptosporangiaceae bacterium]